MPIPIAQYHVVEIESYLKDYGRVAYYSKIMMYGYAEARLSYFVATDTTLFGKFANRHAAFVAEGKNIYFAPAEWIAIGTELAHADLNARAKKITKARTTAESRGEPIPTTADISLEYDDYRKYHADIFNRWGRLDESNNLVALGIKAWASEILVGDAAEELTRPMWQRLRRLSEDTPKQFAEFRSLICVCMSDRSRTLPERMKALFRAGLNACGPLYEIWKNDANFYGEARVRPRPKRKK